LAQSGTSHLAATASLPRSFTSSLLLYNKNAFGSVFRFITRGVRESSRTPFLLAPGDGIRMHSKQKKKEKGR
jgi:hypothetical protein